MNITGVMVQYFVICKRELWFFANKINMDYTDENIKLGKLVEEESFNREKKNINLGNISIDFEINKKDTIIFEIKKSSKLIEGAKYQLYYYLFYLKNLTNKNYKGYLVFPKEKKKIEIVLTNEIEEEIRNIINEIPKIVSLESPPQIISKPYCKKCAYYDLCKV